MSETKLVRVSMTSDTLDPLSPPPLMCMPLSRATEGAGVHIGTFLSHGEPLLELDGQPVHKLTWVADPEKCDINKLRERIRRLIKTVGNHHDKVGRDPAKWTVNAKNWVLNEMAALKKEFHLVPAHSQGEYWAPGSTPPERRSRGPRSNRIQSNAVDLGEFMLPEDEG